MGGGNTGEDWTAFMPITMIISMIAITMATGIFKKRKNVKYEG